MRRFWIPAILVALQGGSAAAIDLWTGNGPFGGPVKTIAIDPLNPQILYAGIGVPSHYLLHGGLFKTINGGATWTLASQGLPEKDIHGIAIDPANSYTLYASTANGLYKSLDGAYSWQRLTSLYLYNTWIDQVVVSPGAPNVVFATVASGLYRTSDGGTSWTGFGNPGGYLGGALALDPSSPAKLYATRDLQSVSRSNDRGLTWTGTATSQSPIPTLFLTVDPTDGDRLFAGTGQGLYVSSDAGSHWSLTGGGLPATGVLCLTVRGNTLFAGTDKSGIYKSTDNGATWFPVSGGLSSLRVAALAQNPNVSSALYAATASGVSTTTNSGASWTDVNTDLRARSIGPIAVDAYSSRVYAGTVSGLFMSDDRGANWQRLQLGFQDLEVESIAIDPHSPFTLYVALVSPTPSPSGPFTQTTLRSDDGGGTWRPAGNGLPNIPVKGFAIDPGSTSTIYAATFGLGVYKSTDGGSSWNAINDGLDDGRLYCLLIDPRNASTLYVGTTDRGIHKSTDAGAHWVRLAASSFRVYSLEIDPASGAIFAGEFTGVARSLDGGITWAPINSGFTSNIPGLHPGILAMAVDRNRPGTLFAGARAYAWDNSDGGLFESNDGGDSWHAVNAGLTSLNVTSIAIDSRDRFVYLGTGTGVFASSLGAAQPDPPPVRPIRPTTRAIPTRPGSPN